MRPERVKLLLLLLVLTEVVFSRTQFDEFQIKAVYLYNFAQFVTWPEYSFADGNPALVICINGNDAINSHAYELEKYNVRGKPIMLREVSASDSLDSCHLLYIANADRTHVKSIVTKLRGKSILTVSGVPEFITHGGMIGFLIVDNKVRFEINLVAVRSANLQLSAKLLEISERNIESRKHEKSQ